MGLLEKLLSTLGLRSSSSGRGTEPSGETTVTVEREPETTSEDAVKGTSGVSEDTTASGSTGTITDTADEDVGAAEPSEAAGDAAGDLDEDVDVDEDSADGAEPVGDEDSADHEEPVEDDEATTDGAEDDTGTSEVTSDEPASGSDESPDVLDGIGPAYAERLENAGVATVADLASADAAALAEETGLGEGRIENWIERAKTY